MDKPDFHYYTFKQKQNSSEWEQSGKFTEGLKKAQNLAQIQADNMQQKIVLYFLKAKKIREFYPKNSHTQPE